ncbi:hypothetical protein ACFVTW_19375, partial [Streptomyces liangshanensis]
PGTAPRGVVGPTKYIQYMVGPPPCEARHQTPQADPRRSAGQALALPADLRHTGTRPPSVREGLSVNPGSRILECESATDGPLLIAVMPDEVAHVHHALTPTPT